MNTVDILKGAREIIARGQWHQGDFSDYAVHQPCFCTLGAIVAVIEGCTEDIASEDFNFADFNIVLSGKASRAATLFKSANSLEALNAVPLWNDDPYRTQEEVVAAFDKAIELAEATQ